jgi:hypothetical protein
MQCPREIAEVIHEILRIGILRIRAADWSSNPKRYMIEADHLHNLPSLLTDYRPELLDYYLTVEQPCYLSHCTEEDIESFQPLWDSLAKLVSQSTSRIMADQSA